MFKSVRMRVSKPKEEADYCVFAFQPSKDGFRGAKESKPTSLHAQAPKGENPITIIKSFADSDQMQPFWDIDVCPDSKDQAMDFYESYEFSEPRSLVQNLAKVPKSDDAHALQRPSEVHMSPGKGWGRSHHRSSSISPNMEATQVTIAHLQNEVLAWEVNAQKAHNEVDRFRQQLHVEQKHATDMTMELTALRGELESMKFEVEQLRTFKQEREDREHGQDKERIEVEDARRAIKELKEELVYEKSVSLSLELQLQKTNESNSELLMEIHELEAALREKDKEVEHLGAFKNLTENVNLSLDLQLQKTNASNSKVLMELHDLETALCTNCKELEHLGAFESLPKKKMQKERRVQTRGPDGGVRDSPKEDSEEPNVALMQLHKDLHDLERDSQELTDENLNLVIQLKDATQKIEAQCDLIDHLEAKLGSLVYRPSPKCSIADGLHNMDMDIVDNEEENLIIVLNNVAQTISLSQDPTMSVNTQPLLNDIEDSCLILCSRNKWLQTRLRCLEDENESLKRGPDGEKEESIHEKEKMLLESQKGQLKGLKEKLAAVSTDYEGALKKNEDMELEMRELREKLLSMSMDYEFKLKRSDDMEAEMKELRKKLASIIADYESCVKRAEEMEMKNANLENEYKYEVENLTRNLSMNQNQLKDVEKSFAFLDSTNKDVEKRLKDAQEENCLQTSHIEELEAHHLILKEENESLNRSVSSLECGNLELQAWKVEMQCTLAESEHKARECKSLLETEIEALSAQIHILQDEAESLTKGKLWQEKSMEQLERRCRSIEEERDAAINEVQEILDDKAELEATLRMVITQQEEELKWLEVEMAKVQNENSECKRLISELQTCIHRMEEEIALSKDDNKEQTSACASLDDHSRDDTAMGVKAQTLAKFEEKGSFVDNLVEEEEKTSGKSYDNLHAELEISQTIIHEMKLEKMSMEASLQKTSLENARLVEELSKHKEKKKAKNTDEGDTKHPKVSLEAKHTHPKERNTKGGKTGLDLEQRNEMVRLKKQVVELKRKLLEREEDKEELRKKALFLEEELQRRAGVLAFTGKKLKEKEKEEKRSPSDVHSPPTKVKSLKRGTSKVRPLSNLNPSNDGKELADLRDKLKLLEGELKIKSVELEAAKYVFREKEAEFYKQVENLESGKENCTTYITNSRLEQLQNELYRLQDQNEALHERERNLLSKIDLQEALLDEVKNLQQEKQHLEGSLSSSHKDDENLSKRVEALELELVEALEANNMYKTQLQRELQATTMEEELLELRERYTHMSLRFAEVDAEREELVFALHRASHNHQRTIDKSNDSL